MSSSCTCWFKRSKANVIDTLMKTESTSKLNSLSTDSGVRNVRTKPSDFVLFYGHLSRVNTPCLSDVPPGCKQQPQSRRREHCGGGFNANVRKENMFNRQSGIRVHTKFVMTMELE
jgi:hypothetical protein